MSSAVISMPGNAAFARGVAAELKLPLVEANVHSFPDAETVVRVSAPPGIDTALVACTLCRPNELVVPLIFLGDTLRDRGLQKLILIAPYLAYMRQDKQFRPDEGISARYFAALLSRYFDALVTVDPHLHRIPELSRVFQIPSRVVHAAPAIAAWIRANVSRPVLVGPDAESRQWVSDVAQLAGAPFTVLQKVREGDYDVSVSLPDAKSWRSRTPVLVDDIISTAVTMEAAIRAILAVDLPAPVCIGVHGIFAGDALARLHSAGASRIITCNSVVHESNGIDLCGPVAEAALQLLQGFA